MPKALSPKPVRNELIDSWGRTNNRKIEDKSCDECGSVYRPKKRESKYCSRPCMWKNNGKHQIPEDGHETWWVDSNGYVSGRVWENGHPYRKRQHRYYIEKHIGRCLGPDEDVHHINGDKRDNRIENLEIISHGKHTSLHNKDRDYTNHKKATYSKAERLARSDRARRIKPWINGQKALAKARGEQS
ncbi:HNH endonuclease [uncultured Methylophaga sp.]|uniref:HNH endonuclease n=1 Tax=uncultured Methylophaga sp. TaxID=285271 RepID=UPI0030F5EF69